MATKPTALPRFGTDQSNEAEPSSGQKDTGWTVDQVPPSSYFNWLHRVTYDWLNYLSSHTRILSLYDIIDMYHESVSNPTTTYLAYNDQFGYVIAKTGSVTGRGVLPLKNLPLGAVLEEFRFRVEDVSGAPWTVKLYVTVDGVATELATASSDGTGSVQTLTLDAVSTTIESGKGYFLVFLAEGEGDPVNADAYLYSAEVDIS